jgi:hypothetical protein
MENIEIAIANKIVDFCEGEYTFIQSTCKQWQSATFKGQEISITFEYSNAPCLDKMYEYLESIDRIRNYLLCDFCIEIQAGNIVQFDFVFLDDR